MLLKFTNSFILCSVESFSVIKVLKLRGVSINNTKKVSILFIMCISTLWSVYNIDNNYEQLKVLLILPIMIIISLIDVKEKLVYDEDIICGIILEIAILVMDDFNRFIHFISQCYFFRAFNILKMIFNWIIWVFIHGGKSVFTNVETLYSFMAFPQFESAYGNAVSCAFHNNFFNYGIYFNKTFFESVLGMALLFIVSGVISELTGSLGAGDVLYFSIIGMFSNICGCFIIFFTSFAICSLYCIISIIILNNKDFEDGLISFTPFISIGFIIFCCVAR